MTAKEFCLKHNPEFKAESHYSFSLLKKVKYYLIREGRKTMYFAAGKTESQAWQEAKKRLVKMMEKEGNFNTH